MSKKNVNIFFLVIFIVSAALRIALATVNREANDDHMEVIGIMLAENRLPIREDCWECFQPKLYYVMVTSLIRAAGMYPGSITPPIIIAAQMLNAVMGIVLMGIVWRFLQTIPIQDGWLKISAFALAAFNPKLIGMNAQATNDTLAVLLSMLAIYFALLFLQNEKNIHLTACIIFLSLGLAAKTNVLVTTAAIALSFLLKAYLSRRRKFLVATALFLSSIMALAGFNPLGQYPLNYQRYGSIVTMNRGIQRYPFPYFFEKTYLERPGIVSIADGFFTFKYFDLLKNPRLTNGSTGYPAHRTSFWTHLFAYAHSVHFDNHPPTWASSGEEYFVLTRAIFILALLPSGMILFGATAALLRFIRAFFAKSLAGDYGLLAISFWAHIAFLILYAMMYRDFSVMKTIYIYPALLSFLFFYLQAGIRLAQQKWFTSVNAALAAVLVILYGADILTLIIHLHRIL